jgi:hypothetical protein
MWAVSVLADACSSSSSGHQQQHSVHCVPSMDVYSSCRTPPLFASKMSAGYTTLQTVQHHPMQLRHHFLSPISYTVGHWQWLCLQPPPSLYVSVSGGPHIPVPVPPLPGPQLASSYHPSSAGQPQPAGKNTNQGIITHSSH